MALRQKISLGTVQLGLPYGINNQLGRPDEVEAHSILERAESEKITLLDSAESYGNSLEVIGSYLKKNRNSAFRVISKFIVDSEPLETKLNKTLSQIGQDRLYALLYHRFTDYTSGLFRSRLMQFIEQGKVDKIGVSIYGDEELELSLHDREISVIQIPFNPFDASPKKKQLLQEARSAGKEIHVRSIFLQGLFFKNPMTLTGNLRVFSDSLKKFHSILEDYGLTVKQACLNYALHQSFTDRVIIGVETRKQLEENLGSITAQPFARVCDELEALPVSDQLLLNPSNWKP